MYSLTNVEAIVEEEDSTLVSPIIWDLSKEGSQLSSEITFTITRDSRDNFINPTTGTRNSISPHFAGSILGGDVTYQKYVFESSTYHRLFWRLVLMLRGKLGIITPESAPIYEKFVLGGVSPWGLRGYPDWSIGLMQDGYLVGGGFAFTTLRSLVNFILHEENRARFGDLTILAAARDPGELIYKEDLEAWEKRDDVALVVTVDKGDEGWTGREGFAAPVLKEAGPSAEDAYAVVCGPPIMIKTCIAVLFELGFPPERILNSLEMRMKCGIGMCGRCNIGGKYVCKDGPVFTYQELLGMPREY